MFASALLTGGVGPWLPFQMLCAAWVGFFAGCLPPARGRARARAARGVRRGRRPRLRPRDGHVVLAVRDVGDRSCTSSRARRSPRTCGGSGRSTSRARSASTSRVPSATRCSSSSRAGPCSPRCGGPRVARRWARPSASRPIRRVARAKWARHDACMSEAQTVGAVAADAVHGRSSAGGRSRMNSEQATVVLVHGAWHGAWCWDAVRSRLDAAGVPNVAVDNPSVARASASLHDDADNVRRVLDEIGGPVVLVGHSYGGAVITDAGSHDAVRRLVYVTAFVVDDGESVMQNDLTGGEDTTLLEALQMDGDIVRVDPAAPRRGLLPRLRTGGRGRRGGAAEATVARRVGRRSPLDRLARQARDLRAVHRRPRPPGCAPAIERGAHRRRDRRARDESLALLVAARRARRDPGAVRRGLTARSAADRGTVGLTRRTLDVGYVRRSELTYTSSRFCVRSLLGNGADEVRERPCAEDGSDCRFRRGPQ